MSSVSAPRTRTTPAAAPALPPPWSQRLLTLVPLGGIAWLAIALAEHPAVARYGLSALTLAMCAGMVAANTLPRHWLAPLAPGMQVARHQIGRAHV